MMVGLERFLIFTDLDGTLLDYHSYSFDAARPALERIREKGIPLIIVTSKTRSEMEALLDRLPIDPQVYIVENCGAIYFRQAWDSFSGLESAGSYFKLRLGMPYEDVLQRFREAQKECGLTIHGFSTMSEQEVSDLTGLNLASAARAKEREYSEPFIFEGEPEENHCLIQALEKKGLICIEGGRFKHVLGRCDKGTAVRTTCKFFHDTFPEVRWKTIGLGDSPNDFSLLKAVDTAVLVQRFDGSYAKYQPEPGQVLIKTPCIGPSGWNQAILELIDKGA